MEQNLVKNSSRGEQSVLKISKVGVIAKEGHGEARDVAKDLAQILLDRGLSVVSFPNLHVKGADHVSNVKETAAAKIDLLVTVSGDGTTLRMLRTLDDPTPCLCVNVGGRGILAEIKPNQAKVSIDRILAGDYSLERRSRISASLRSHSFPPALNEVHILRQTVAHTPMFTLDFDNGAVFTQRMDGIMMSTPTGSTGHSYSYGAPFIEGSLDSFVVTPIGPITRFPVVVKKTSEQLRIMGTYALNLVIDGQEVFTVEADSFVVLRKHERDAVFVRFDTAGPFRQLKNLGFS